MKMIFQTILAFTFFILSHSFTYIDNYVLTNFSGTNYTFALVDNAGSEGFIGLQQNGTKKINRYQIVGSDAILLGSYLVENTQPDNLMFYESYLIVYSDKNKNLTVFNKSNYSQEFSFSIQNFTFRNLSYLRNRNIVLFTTIQGDFGYITNFLANNSLNFVTNSSFGEVTYKSSPDQNFLVFLQGFRTDVLVYQLQNFTIVSNLTLNLTYYPKYYRTCWNLNSSKFYVIPKQQGKIFIININNGSFLLDQQQTFSQYYSQSNSTLNSTNLTSNISLNSLNSSNLTNVSIGYTFYINNSQIFLAQNILKVIQVTYSQNQNCLIIAAYFQSLHRVIIFTFDPVNSLILNYQKFHYYENSLVGLRFDQQRDQFYVVWTSQSVLFYKFVVSGGGGGGGGGDGNYQIINQNSLIYQYGISNNQLRNQQGFLFGIRQIFIALSKVPGCRTILKPFFSFFANFDDIWLYIYHPRRYNRVITQVFMMTVQIQNAKWNVLPYQTLWSTIGVKVDDFQAKMNEKLVYTNWKFIQIEESTNGFIYNTSNFFFSNVILIFCLFILLKILFLILFTRKISLLFRPFSFWITYIIMITDGNVQYMAYLFGFQMTHFFNFNFASKISSTMVLIIFYALFMFAGCSFYFIRNFYGRLSKYMFDNANTSSNGAFYLTAQIGYKNILLGLLHSFVNTQNYISQVWILIVFEIIFMSLMVSLLFQKNSYVLKFKMWILIVTTFVRILMIFTLTIDHKENSIFYFYENIDIVLVYLYFLLAGISILYQITNFIIQVYQIIRSSVDIQKESVQNEKKEKNIFQQDQNMLTSESMGPFNPKFKSVTFRDQMLKKQKSDKQINININSNPPKEQLLQPKNQQPAQQITFRKQNKPIKSTLRKVRRIKTNFLQKNKEINKSSLKIENLKSINVIQDFEKQNQMQISRQFQRNYKKPVIKTISNIFLNQNNQNE